MTNPRQALEEAWNVIHPFNDPASDCSFPKACRKCDRFRRFLDAEAWTDAAMMLVPDNLRLQGIGEGKSGIWTCDLVDRETRRCVAIGSHQNPALALAQACLKARENSDG